MDNARIFIGIGANLSSARFGAPPGSFAAALGLLGGHGVAICQVSRWYRSAPLPPSDQPHYINGVIEARSSLSPRRVLEACHQVERDFGRVRGEKNAARCLDLDLLAYGARVIEAVADASDGDCDGDCDGQTVLPHPRIADRAFVLVPWAELAPEWRHPVSGRSVGDMLAALAPAQDIERLAPIEAGG